MCAQNDHAKRVYRRPVVPESSVVNVLVEENACVSFQVRNKTLKKPTSERADWRTCDSCALGPHWLHVLGECLERACIRGL
jgi:hypothetical protein